MVCRNVEIKATVKNIERLQQLARSLTNSEPEVLCQVDTFYKVSSGRLKLRQFKSNQISQLVYYNRPDTEGPKVSDYSICEVGNPNELDNILKSALGHIGTVRKTRYLYIYQQTRIHIDIVESLGNFMELEVVLTPEQTLEDGQVIADYLMKKLEIGNDDLISGAYLDQLKN